MAKQTPVTPVTSVEPKAVKPKATRKERLAKMQAAKAASMRRDVTDKLDLMQVLVDGIRAKHNEFGHAKVDRLLKQAARVQIFLGLGKTVPTVKIVKGEGKAATKRISWTALSREEKDEMLAALRQGHILRFDAEDGTSIDLADAA